MVYAGSVTPRLSYVAGLVLGDMLGLSYEIVSDRRRLGSYPFINYSNDHQMEGGFTILPSGLLAEDGIRDFMPVAERTDGDSLILFPSGDKGDISFDIFSAVFYMVSRYEEYLPYRPDNHGRFPAEASFACRNGFLNIPVVDIWVGILKMKLLKYNPYLTFRRSEFRGIVTFDLDVAYAFRGRGLLRTAGGVLRDVAKGRNPLDRLRSVAGLKDDPYDVYDYILESLRKSGCEALFFIPLGRLSVNDRNCSRRSGAYSSLVSRISTAHRCGIHLSYLAGSDYSLITAEKEAFIRITGDAPEYSRNHYLRLSLPGGYRALTAAGIGNDFTMGYADMPGFRAGTSLPFLFYDLVGESATSLKVWPFQVMDVTLRNYLKCDVSQACGIIDDIADRVSEVGGTFISVWHNTSLTEDDGWEGWREPFEHLLRRTGPDE